jgi:hypothetical protein
MNQRGLNAGVVAVASRGDALTPEGKRSERRAGRAHAVRGGGGGGGEILLDAQPPKRGLARIHQVRLLDEPQGRQDVGDVVQAAHLGLELRGVRARAEQSARRRLEGHHARARHQEELHELLRQQTERFLASAVATLLPVLLLFFFLFFRVLGNLRRLLGNLVVLLRPTRRLGLGASAALLRLGVHGRLGFGLGTRGAGEIFRLRLLFLHRKRLFRRGLRVFHALLLLLVVAPVQNEVLPELLRALLPQPLQRGGHARDAVPGVLVLRLPHHNLHRLEHVDDVVDAPALDAQLSGSLVQRNKLLLAGAVQVQEVLAEQAEAAVTGVFFFFFFGVSQRSQSARLRSKRFKSGVERA